MNETIALPIFAEQFARIAGTDIQSAEKFIRAFFAQLENALTVSDEVTVKGLGTFYRTNNHCNPIGFNPDKELSDALNEPFSIFEPVEIADGMDSDTLDTEIVSKKDSEVQETEQSEPEQILPIQIDDEEDSTEEAEKSEADETINECDEPVEEIVDETEEEIEEINDTDDEIPSENDETYTDDTTNDEPHRNSWLPKILFFILGVVVGFVIGYFKDFIIPAGTQSNIEPIDSTAVSIDETVIAAEPIVTDSITFVEPDSITSDTDRFDEQKIIEPEAEPVYDTVTPERFLTTMARKYYGRMEYWVFIYEANADKLGNPNRIKPGTEVVIPDIATLTKGETPEQTLQRAKRMGREIYARFE